MLKLSQDEYKYFNNDDANSESQVSDLDDDKTFDTETDRATTLAGSEPKTHRRRYKAKFLDALAELLSPKHRWSYINTTSLQGGPGGVTITVARNDRFTGDGQRYQYLVGQLGAYLSSDNIATLRIGALSSFEVALVEHSRNRVEHWLNSFRRNVGTIHTIGNAIWQASLNGLESA